MPVKKTRKTGSSRAAKSLPVKSLSTGKARDVKGGELHDGFSFSIEQDGVTISQFKEPPGKVSKK